MIDRVEPAAMNTRPVVHLRPALHRLLGPLTVAWLLLVPVLAMRVAGPPPETLQTVLRVHPERWESLFFALLCVAVAVAVVVIAGLLNPAWWRRTMASLMLVPVPIFLLTSGNLVAGLTVAAIVAPCLWAGRQLTSRSLGIRDACDAWSIGSGLGLIALAVFGTVLLVAGTLHAPVIWSFILLLTLILVWSSRQQLRDDVASFTNWLQQPSWQRLEARVASGLILGTYWLALIGALAPEFMSDAVRQRLPAAALFAREGRFVVNPDNYVTTSPRLGEVLYAIMLACGPLEAAKLLNFVVGLLCALAVWNLGRHLGGGKVALLALLAFATLPLSLFLAQVAYVDLFATLFALTAALILIAVDRVEVRTVLAVALCLVAGFEVKNSFVFAGLGLAVALGLIMVDRISPKIAGFLATAALVGLAVGALWTTETYLALGEVPLLSPVVAALSSAHSILDRYVVDLGYRTTRSLSDLVRIPLDLVTSTGRYGEYAAGFVGYLLVPLAPLVLFVRPGHRARLLLIGIGAALLSWFALIQYVRYALPMLAILAAFGAAAYVTIREQSSSSLRPVMSALPLLLAAIGLIGYLNTALLSPGIVPFRVVLGQESKTDYLTDHVTAYSALRLLDAEPGATRAATDGEYAQIYSAVPLSDLGATARNYPELNTEAGLLGFLKDGGVSHIIVDRDVLKPGWDGILAFDEAFLRRNAILVGGSHNAYLYRLVPASDRGHEQVWAEGQELLPNPGFEEWAESAPRGWVAKGKVKRVTSGRGFQTPETAVRVEPRSVLATTVEVTPGAEYLFSQASKGVGAEGTMRMEISWFSEDKSDIGTVAEVVPTSESNYHRFSMLATAPANARWATVKLQPASSQALIDDVSLRAFAAPAQ